MKLDKIAENEVSSCFFWELRLRKEFVALSITDNDNWFTYLNKCPVTDVLIEYSRGLLYAGKSD